MKKLLLTIVGLFGLFTLNAQTDEKCYVYGVDFSQAKVFAAEESVEDFAKAFEAINLLLVTESEKYDFTRFLGRDAVLVLDPMMKLLASNDYSNLKTYQNEIPEINYSECVKKYVLPQKEGVGVVLMAKLLNKPSGCATYTLVVFDIATRSIRFQKDLTGISGGFGLRNYWARTVYNILATYKVVY